MRKKTRQKTNSANSMNKEKKRIIKMEKNRRQNKTNKNEWKKEYLEKLIKIASTTLNERIFQMTM